MKKFYKRPWFIILSIIIVLTAAGIVFFRIVSQPVSPYEFATVARGNIKQEVSVTGRVKPAQSVVLAFQISGKVASAPVKIGDNVVAGQILATLANADLSAQLAQAQASLASQQAKLDELKRGSRIEEIQTARTSVDNAQKSLADAEANLITIKNQADANLQQVYSGSLAAAVKSVTVGINSIYVLTDIQYAHFLGVDQSSDSIALAKARAVLALLGGADTGRWGNAALSQLSGGTKALVQATQLNSTNVNIDLALSEVGDTLEKVKAALEVMPVAADLTSTERTNLNTEKTNINAEITIISGKQESIRAQKSTNDYSLAAAQSAVTTARNTLALAQDQLALKLAGASSEEIASQTALVNSAQANVESAKAQLAKTIISSPISGLVTKQEAKVGEIITANSLTVSVISAAQFEIEANVPEADIAKVKVGDSARVTLDTYGNEVIFDTQVVTIDPAETILEGVATYRVTLQFTREDSRIKSGMTANVDILTASQSDVLVIPQRAVSTKSNSDRTVRVLETDGQTVKEIKIEVGLRGSDGNIEVLSGLGEGERIISFQKQ